MAIITWDEIGERYYETGIKNCVLYPVNNGAYSTGVAWNGITALTESPSGAEANPLYADDIKYLNLISAEELGATIEAYTYPDEFAECDGSVEPTPGVKIGQQKRKMFGLAYVTTEGNDTAGADYGYKLHLLYGCQAAPTERAYATINDSPEAITFSWEITTTPVAVPGYKNTSLITIDSTKVDSTNLQTLKDALYGTATTEPRLPLPAEVLSILTSGTTQQENQGEQTTP